MELQLGRKMSWNGRRIEFKRSVKRKGVRKRKKNIKKYIDSERFD